MKKVALKRPFLILAAAVTTGCILAWQQNYRTVPDYAPPLVQESLPVSEPSHVVVAVGDISCSTESKNYNSGNGTDTACHMKQTADLARRLKPEVLLLLGDLQYETGDAKQFEQSYSKTWGVEDLKKLSRPAVGNHEYGTKDAAPYYNYFGSAAGKPQKGYYSYSIGDWHAIVLNSNCDYVACDISSQQFAWLKNDLMTHQNKCSLVYYHHPRYSSGTHGQNDQIQPLYQLLVQNHVELALSGHDHLYERFSLLNAEGNIDPSGIKNFVVGTGGKDHYPFRKVQTGSEVRISDSFGVLKLELRDKKYNWQFIDENNTVLDAGSSNCQ